MPPSYAITVCTWANAKRRAVRKNHTQGKQCVVASKDRWTTCANKCSNWPEPTTTHAKGGYKGTLCVTLLACSCTTLAELRSGIVGKHVTTSRPVHKADQAVSTYRCSHQAASCAAACTTCTRCFWAWEDAPEPQCLIPCPRANALAVRRYCQVQHPVAVACQCGELCHAGVLPHNQLVLAVPMG